MSEAKSRCYASDLMAGQVALVTGSGSGMGRATAIEMAACGARLALFARRMTGMQEIRGAELRVRKKSRLSWNFGFGKTALEKSNR